jgi:YD repeat-containing protein
VEAGKFSSTTSSYSDLSFSGGTSIKGVKVSETKTVSATQTSTTDFSSFDSITGNPTVSTRRNVGLFFGDSLPRNLISTTLYDMWGNVQELRNEEGVITQTNTYDSADRLTRSLDQAGVASVTVYDALGNVKESYREKGATKLDWTKTEYTPSGQALTQTSHDSSGAVIQTINNEYDNLARMTKTTDSVVPGHTTFSYTPAGEQTIITDTVGTTAVTATGLYDSEGQLKNSNVEGEITRIDYTASGEVKEQIDPDKTKTINTYNKTTGNLDSSIETIEGKATGQTTSYKYNLTGDIIEVTAPGTSAQKTSYDLDGNVIEEEALNSSKTTHTYNMLGCCFNL